MSEKIDIMVVSLCCEDELYEYILNSRKVKHVDPAQKFFRNIIYGLRDNERVNSVSCISATPVSKSTHDKFNWVGETKVQDDVVFNSLTFKNGFISRYITQSKSTKGLLVDWIINSKYRKLILVDSMVAHLSKTVSSVANKYSIPVMGVVTDLPLQWLKMKKVHGNLLRRLFYIFFNTYSENTLNWFDGYVWLTEDMNALKNKKGKPYCIVEGAADYDFIEKPVDMILPDRFAMYAGGIHTIFQIGKLCDAFVLANTGDSLVLFGDGNEVEAIKEKYKGNSHIIYKGVVSSDEVRWIEHRARLLINPRPTTDSYTKYSFPSKTLEYMTSGTPVLSTRLKGIPEEYDPYLFWFDEEDINSMANQIRTVLRKNDVELDEFGERARSFVREKKNAKIQAGKILDTYFGYFWTDDRG